LLRSIVIPSSVTTISGRAFALCHVENLGVEEGSSKFQVLGQFLLDFSGRSLIRYFGCESSVCLLWHIEILCESCFAACDKLEGLNFESGSLIQEFSVWVFTRCSSLKSIVIPGSVRKIHGSAFSHSGITSITVASDSSNFRTDESFLLDSSGGLIRYFGTESNVTIPRSIVTLRRYCFVECDALRQLLFESESNLVDIEEWVVCDCTNLELIDLPASLVNVHGSAFAQAPIAKISIDAGNRRLRVIGDFLVDITRARLIRYFGSSSEIILSRAVEVIGTYCFASCADLALVSFERGSTLSVIERFAFFGCPLLKSMIIPASVTTIMGGAFALSGIRHISVEEGNTHFCMIGEFLLDFARTSLIAFFGTSATVTIDRRIKTLCDCCFADHTSISRVEFAPGSDLRRIEWCAFGGCSSLHTIRIPSSIESLEREWFRFSCVDGGFVFDTVQFESAESLSKMIIGDCADLNGNFDIEILNFDGATQIPGYCVDRVISGNFVRLKKSSESVIVSVF
jgi:hypothetical protein